jgi:hypothetical protein
MMKRDRDWHVSISDRQPKDPAGVPKERWIDFLMKGGWERDKHPIILMFRCLKN